MFACMYNHVDDYGYDYDGKYGSSCGGIDNDDDDSMLCNVM